MGSRKPPFTSWITDDDLYLFNEGTHYKIYEKLGAHFCTLEGKEGVHFAVWAPNAKKVSVIGDFNSWDRSANAMQPTGQSGIWEAFLTNTVKGTLYKYYIESNQGDYRVEKADPLAFYAEKPPGTASIIWNIDYDWNDQNWMEKRYERNSLNAPISIYEVHIGSWRRVPEEGNRYLSYREIAQQLSDYVKSTGFTHVEFLPVMEHPFYGSWGYQTTGYFTPTSRYGTPQDFMYLVDQLHQHDIGVILDWVPSHFPADEHGPGFFDGTHLYEHADPRQGIHPDWNSMIFNYGRNEVLSFLYSSALFWLNIYHIDCLRVDAVASMLYLDYGRKQNEWIPNKFRGRENLEAIEFLRNLNEAVYKESSGAQMIAEESTAWPLVSRPVNIGGLGFDYKWDMGWMHDTLDYISKDPIYRKYHQNSLTFRTLYAFYENFILPLSHDEVVHGKSSLIGKMPGDNWQKSANLRLLLGYMYGQGGKKLLFMGGEFGQWHEWNHDESLEWHLLQYHFHLGIQRWVADLNRLYRSDKALYELDCESEGFEWIDADDVEHSVISFIRKGRSGEQLVILCNFTPATHFSYRSGVPEPGLWQEVLNSDALIYGGSGQGNMGSIEASPISLHGHPYSLSLTIPPLGILFLKPELKI